MINKILKHNIYCGLILMAFSSNTSFCTDLHKISNGYISNINTLEYTGSYTAKSLRNYFPVSSNNTIKMHATIDKQDAGVLTYRVSMNVKKTSDSTLLIIMNSTVLSKRLNGNISEEYKVIASAMLNKHAEGLEIEDVKTTLTFKDGVLYADSGDVFYYFGDSSNKTKTYNGINIVVSFNKINDCSCFKNTQILNNKSFYSENTSYMCNKPNSQCMDLYNFSRVKIGGYNAVVIETYVKKETN